MTAQLPDDEREFAYGTDDDGALLFRQVALQDLDYTGRFGALATSTTENTIAIGEAYFTLDIDSGMFRVGDDVLINSIDRDCFMWGEVIGSDTVSEPVRLRIFIDDISNVTGTYSEWTLQVVARPKPGIEKDTSTTSVDPTTGGPWTFAVTAGKFFPIGGTLLIKPTTDRSIALIGEVKAYSGTSLTVSLRSTNATVSQSYDSWSIALLDSPPAKLPYDAIAGLRVTLNAGDSRYFDVAPGSVRSADDTTDLILGASLTKRANETFVAGTNGGAQVRVLLSGTISSSGSAVTGSGTAFLTDFATSSLDGLSLTTRQISTGDGVGGPIQSVTNDTSLTTSTFGNLGASADAYYRGGWPGSSNLGRFGIIVARKDSDGSIDVILSAVTPSGSPDLPSGYTKYRAIGYLVVLSNAIIFIEQTLKEVSFSELSAIEAYAIVGNNSASARYPDQIVISSLTEKATPAAGDFYLLSDGSASGALRKVDAANVGTGGATFPADMGLITESATISFDAGTIV